MTNAVRLALLVLGLILPGLAAAETRALLIGVSAYDPATGIASLRGPANDVRLLKGVLEGQGVANIRVLADGVEGGERPTRAAILAAFADEAREAGPGDLVMITMSGHGTRQYDASGDETDGLDEVFLPADVGRAQAGQRGIPNALIDDEIGAAVLAIRRTGADVWLVLDSCHSGSGLRAATPNTADRFVDPATLGVPEAAAAPGAASLDPMDEDAPGKVVAFYAARSSEVAREVNLTPDAPDASGWYGLFTARLAARLETAEGLSYRQLFQAVLSDLNAAGAPAAGQLQTPSWEGGLIDAAVFGGQATLGVRQFAIRDGEVAAGLVHGLPDGTLMALYADAADAEDAALGYAQTADTGATTALLVPVAGDCTPRAAEPCPAAGRLPEAARFARLVARPLDLALRLAPLRDLATGAPVPDTSPEAQALAAAMAAVNASGAAQVVTDPAAAQVEVAAEDGTLWFGRRVAIGETPVGLAWRPGDGPLEAILTRIAEAERFAALLENASQGGSALNPSPVSVGAALTASRPADLDPPGAGGSPARECRRALSAAAGPAPLPLAEAPELKQCDRVDFSAQGSRPGARDVNRVHIDSRFCLHAAHVRIEDFAAPAPLGAPMILCSDCPDGYAAGDERLFVIVTEAERNADQLNLEGLVENCGAEGPTRSGAAGQEAIDFLTRLGRRPDTRGAFGSLTIPAVWVSAYRWQVLPKSEVFLRAAAAEE